MQRAEERTMPEVFVRSGSLISSKGRTSTSEVAGLYTENSSRALTVLWKTLLCCLQWNRLTVSYRLETAAAMHAAQGRKKTFLLKIATMAIAEFPLEIQSLAQELGCRITCTSTGQTSV